jgi:hypothetical protein
MFSNIEKKKKHRKDMINNIWFRGQLPRIKMAEKRNFENKIKFRLESAN